MFKLSLDVTYYWDVVCISDTHPNNAILPNLVKHLKTATTVVDITSFSFSLIPEILSRFFFIIYYNSMSTLLGTYNSCTLYIVIRGIWIMSNLDVFWNLNTFYPRITLSDQHVIMLSGLVTLVCEYCKFFADLHVGFSADLAYN